MNTKQITISNKSVNAMLTQANLNNPFTQHVIEGQAGQKKRLTVSLINSLNGYNYSDLNARDLVLGLSNPFKCSTTLRGRDCFDSLNSVALVLKILPYIQQCSNDHLERLSANDFNFYLQDFTSKLEIFIQSIGSNKCMDFRESLASQNLTHELEQCYIGEMKLSFRRLKNSGLLDDLYDKIPSANGFLELMANIVPEYQRSGIEDTRLIPEEPSLIWLEHYLRIETIKLNSYGVLSCFICKCSVPQELFNNVLYDTMHFINRHFILLDQKSANQVKSMMWAIYDVIMSLSDFKKMDVIRLRLFERLLKNNFLDAERKIALAKNIVNNLSFFNKEVEFVALRILCYLIEKNFRDNSQEILQTDQRMAIAVIQQRVKQWEKNNVIPDLVNVCRSFFEFLFLNNLIDPYEGNDIIENLYFLNNINIVYQFVYQDELSVCAGLSNPCTKLFITNSNDSPTDQETFPESSEKQIVEYQGASSIESTQNQDTETHRNKMLIMFFLVLLISLMSPYLLSSDN